MSPIPAAAAAPTIKAASQITSALIGRYRPSGVPRAGSREDRSQTYQRLLDAATHSFSNIYMFRHMRKEVGRSADKVLEAQIPQVWQDAGELMCGLAGVRLRGTIPVIAAAEDLVSALSDYEMNEPSDAKSKEQADRVAEARDLFLDVARTDLAYDTKPWQLWRRYKEKKFLRGQAAAEAIEA